MSDRPRTASTELPPRWRPLARALWVALAALMLTLFAIALPARYQLLFEVCAQPTCVPGQLAPAGMDALAQLGLSVTTYARLVVTYEIIFVVIFASVGLAIAWRKPSDWMALLVALMLVVVGATAGAPLDALMAAAPAWSVPAGAGRALGWASLILLYIFPNGRFVPHSTRLLAAALLLSSLLVSLTRFAYPSLPAFALLMLWLFTGAYAQIYRYRRVSSAVERQQTKWVVFGFTLAAFGLLAGVVTPAVLFAPRINPPNEAVASVESILFVLLGIPLLGFGFTLLVPLSIAFSILRYRLWDIDILIRRTLVYGIVSAVLASMYALSVIVLGTLFGTLLGQRQPELVTVLATLGIAALFAPVRGRVQASVDRRFYRRKYDAAHMLQRFGSSARDEVDLNRLTAQLRSVVDETMQPAHLSLWLRESARSDPDKQRS